MLDKDAQELGKEQLAGAPQKKGLIKEGLLNIANGTPSEAAPTSMPTNGITPDQAAAIPKSPLPQEAVPQMPTDEGLPNLEMPAENIAGPPMQGALPQEPKLAPTVVDENGYDPGAHNGSFKFNVINGTKGYKPGE